MALATRCPNCHALFRVAADQLKLRGGLVRCGACRHVFDATGTLSYVDDSTLATPAHPAAPAVGAVIAAIRKAESTASEPLSAHGVAPFPSAPAAARPLTDEPAAAEQTASAVPTHLAAAVPADLAAGEPPPAGGPPGVAQDDNDLSHEPVGKVAEVPGHEETTGDDAVAREPQPITEPAAPEFLREAGPHGTRRTTVLFGIGALLLAGVLAAQLATAFRAEILAKFPQARPALSALCEVFRCTVGWPARGELLAVVGSELQAMPGTAVLELTAIVRNRSNMTLALPAIELTLSDTLNRTVARKVFLPTDYLGGQGDPQARLLAGLEAGADLTVRIAFEARGLNAAGFVVYPFYL